MPFAVVAFLQLYLPNKQNPQKKSGVLQKKEGKAFWRCGLEFEIRSLRTNI